MSDFNESRFYLGPLCVYGHEYEETGCSLRYRTGHKCRACVRARGSRVWIPLDRAELCAAMANAHAVQYLRAKLDAHLDRGDPDACWLWTGSTNRGGYGDLVITIGGHSRRLCAHQLSYLLEYGELPAPPLLVRHKVCGERLCCNPAHLEAGTYRDNADDAIRMGRYKHGDAHWTRKFPDRLAWGDRNPARRHPEAMPHGERHWSARLNEEKVALIRGLLSEKVSLHAIARVFGVTVGTVHAIAQGRTWRSVSSGGQADEGDLEDAPHP